MITTNDACPYCGCQIMDPFGIGKIVHNIDLCEAKKTTKEMHPTQKASCPHCGTKERYRDIYGITFDCLSYRTSVSMRQDYQSDLCRERSLRGHIQVEVNFLRDLISVENKAYKSLHDRYEEGVKQQAELIECIDKLRLLITHIYSQVGHPFIPSGLLEEIEKNLGLSIK